jgi:hypothetical protein
MQGIGPNRLLNILEGVRRHKLKTENSAEGKFAAFEDTVNKLELPYVTPEAMAFIKFQQAQQGKQDMERYPF